jgi:hypothetical protein
VGTEFNPGNQPGTLGIKAGNSIRGEVLGSRKFTKDAGLYREPLKNSFFTGNFGYPRIQLASATPPHLAKASAGVLKPKHFIGVALILLATLSMLFCVVNPKSLNGLHQHNDDEKHCIYCGSSSYGNGCLQTPTRKHIHGHGAGKCVYCGSIESGMGCKHSLTGNHQK